MPAKRKKYYSNFLKEETSPEFAKAFKEVLLNPKLSYGCRVWLLSLTTLHPSYVPSFRKYGRKLGVDGKQIVSWRNEAAALEFFPSFRPEL